MQNLSFQQVEQWINHYYQNPQPDLIVEAIATLKNEGYLSDETLVEPIIIFLSFIFRSHPEKIEAWLSPFQDLTDSEAIIIAYVLWYSNTRQANNYLAAWTKTAQREIKEFIIALQAKIPPSIEQIPISSPSVLDMLWSAFMATGEEKYVIRLMSVLPYINLENNPTQQLIGDTAKWSLISNAIHHDKVMSICVHQLTQQTEEIASILETIIAESKK